MKLQENVSLAKHTSFKIGGPAKYFFIAKDKKDLIKAIEKAKAAKLAFFILGGGSNVLALDKGYNGLIIKFQTPKLENLVELSVKNSLTGLEWAAGIPGTVGGAVYGNAQAFGTKMSDIIKNIEVLDVRRPKGRRTSKTISKQQCQFSEKDSIFKNNKNLIILSVELNLKKGNKKKIEKEIKKHIKLRKQKHPLNYPSAGSVFVNQEGGPSSSYLIEKAGLKGIKLGGAMISKKHAGFIINTGNASSQDVLDLIKIIQQKVKSKFGIDLKPEIQIIK